MRRLVKIVFAIAAFAAVSCRELPDYLVGDNIVARVGRQELTIEDIHEILPANIKGADSVAYVKQYVDKWMVRCLKVEEADRLFPESEEDIDRLVEEYRQTLLVGKVDQYYVEKAAGEDFTDDDIAEYYNTHKSDFTLDRTLVKGRILRFDNSYRQSLKLKDQMKKAASSSTDNKSFEDLCEKNGFLLIDYRSEWVNFADFLANLPTTMSQDYEPLLDKLGIQEMKVNDARYYFDFTSVCRKGNVAPLEIVSENIRRILHTQRRSGIIKNHEQSIFDDAVKDGHAKIYKDLSVAEPSQDTANELMK